MPRLLSGVGAAAALLATTAAVVVMMMAEPAAAQAGPPSSQHKPGQRECVLIEDWFGMVVQGLLGVVAFLSLVAKHHLETPQRQWSVFLRDASKQAFGAVWAHILNMGVAMLMAKYGNSCTWYFVNYLFDNILGIYFNYLFLKLIEGLAAPHTNRLRSGHYGDAHEVEEHWKAQLAVWLLVITLTKTLILVAMLYPFHVPLYNAGSYLLLPFRDFPRMELLFVMILVPFALNIIQFWVQDSYLMVTPPSSPRGPASAPSDAAGDTSSATRNTNGLTIRNNATTAAADKDVEQQPLLQ
eukprot:TRINITY_DN5911_c0_g1_i1.p2 TRINITY_DN5911_c0_g1~~TRINITY_DN5911_c0_g1_i1.p2  ORF type:complete len:297 (-),score=151.60 TRINITY_DN5911_c0_g1_i1:29-919(-)